jgi:hypothetical protein
MTGLPTTSDGGYTIQYFLSDVSDINQIKYLEPIGEYHKEVP